MKLLTWFLYGHSPLAYFSTFNTSIITSHSQSEKTATGKKKPQPTFYAIAQLLWQLGQTPFLNVLFRWKCNNYHSSRFTISLIVSRLQVNFHHRIYLNHTKPSAPNTTTQCLSNSTIFSGTTPRGVDSVFSLSQFLLHIAWWQLISL